MGFSSLIDILGAMVIGGIMLLTLFRVNETAVANNYYYTNDMLVQLNLVEVVRLIEHDFKKIGYCRDFTQIPIPSRAILRADTSSISFLTDVDNNGIVDTLNYYLGTTVELNMTANPRDRLLYRRVNSEIPRSANLGVIQFNIVYFNPLYDQLSTPVSEPGEIAYMQINVRVENINAYDENYAGAFWRQIRLAARNLQNR